MHRQNLVGSRCFQAGFGCPFDGEVYLALGQLQSNDFAGSDRLSQTYGDGSRPAPDVEHLQTPVLDASVKNSPADQRSDAP